MKTKTGRVILAAGSSGSGKTIITCGLMEAMKKRGLRIQAYKCGPDYIDPMFHSKILGIRSENLDTFFADEGRICSLLARGEDKDIEVIEGVMGIYDGIGGMSENGSAYDLAKKTKTPIILIFDGHGMGRTMISLLKGLIEDDEAHLIKGIILNRVSENICRELSPEIFEKTGVPVIGCVPKLKEINLESRHLGLKLPKEVENLKEQVARIAEQMEKTVRLDDVMEIASGCGDLWQWDYSEKAGRNIGPSISESSNNAGKTQDIKISETKRIKLAVAYDEVFCFYYAENLRILEKYGAELVYFSPLHDEKLPEGISGILLGGGYPELKLEALEKNASMRYSIKNAIDSGMPTIAECGGFMYLHEKIRGDDGKEYEMVGAVNGICYNTGKLSRFGYVTVKSSGLEIKGHEFHYFDSTAVGCDAIARKASNGKEWRFGYVDEKRFWGFPHLYYGSNEEFAATYIDEIYTRIAKQH